MEDGGTRLLKRMPALLFACLCLLACLAALAEEEAATGDAIEYVEPKLNADAIPWDSNHPELLDDEMLYARSAILIQADTGEVIYEKNADEMLYPASTTKILTAYIALQISDLSNDVVTVSRNAVDSVPPTYEKIPLIAGEEIRMEDLITATLIKSGNDGANAIAEYISGSTENFAVLMNNTADMLGCSSLTHFTNPSGIHDENHYTTVRDMAIIAQAAMKDERFASIVRRNSCDLPATVNGHPARTIVGRTYILDPEHKAYYPYCTGVKTGFTNAAGYCFVGSARRNGIDLISVVFYSSANGRWSDTRKLMEYGFTQIESITPESLYAESPRVIEIAGFDLDDAKHGELTLGIRAVDEDRDMTVVGRKDTIDMLRASFSQVSSIVWTKEFRAPINVGDVMGILTFYSQNKGSAQYELVATRSVAARKNAPPTLEQIEAYTMADPNPLPRFSWDLLIPPAVVLLALFFLLRLLSKRQKKPKVPRNLKESNKRIFR